MKAFSFTLIAIGLALVAAPAATAAEADITFELTAAQEGGEWVWERNGEINPTLEAPAGAVIHFEACGGGSAVPHNIKVGDLAESELFQDDECVTYEYTMPDSGSVQYVCTIHPNSMLGTLALPGQGGNGGGNGGDGGNDSPGIGVIGAALALLGAALYARRK